MECLKYAYNFLLNLMECFKYVSNILGVSDGVYTLCIKSILVVVSDEYA